MTSKQEQQEQIDKARAEYLAKGGKVRHLPDDINEAERLARKALDMLPWDLVPRGKVRSAVLPKEITSKSKPRSKARQAQYYQAKAKEKRSTL